MDTKKTAARSERKSRWQFPKTLSQDPYDDINEREIGFDLDSALQFGNNSSNQSISNI